AITRDRARCGVAVAFGLRSTGRKAACCHIAQHEGHDIGAVIGELKTIQRRARRADDTGWRHVGRCYPGYRDPGWAAGSGIGIGHRPPALEPLGIKIVRVAVDFVDMAHFDRTDQVPAFPYRRTTSYREVVVLAVLVELVHAGAGRYLQALELAVQHEIGDA